VDAATFRSQLTEFADTAVYPDAAITLHLTVAGKFLDPVTWDTLLDAVTVLFVAHMLVLGARNKAAAATGGIPGAVQGPTTAKSVDKVSVSYDAGSISLTDMGFWGLTSYGIQFLQYVRLMGAGGVQM